MIDEKKLIERLEEIPVENTCSDCPHKEKCDEVQENITDETTDLCGATIKALAIEIVNQLAEEYKQCSKPTCKDCEVYDTEKHYCPKWCEVIKHTTEELAEEYNNDVCEWKFEKTGIVWHCNGCETYNLPYAMNLRIIADDFECKCPHCGKRIKVVE